MCSVSIAGADFFSSDPVVGGGSIKSAAAAEATAAPPNNKDDFKNPLRFFLCCWSFDIFSPLFGGMKFSVKKFGYLNTHSNNLDSDSRFSYLSLNSK
jgi:hypothetical protein